MNMIRTRHIVRTWLLGLFCALFVRPVEGGDSLKVLRILHWNDFHSHNTPSLVPRSGGSSETRLVGGAAALFGYIEQLRAENVPTIILNAGDDFQGTPISSITKGFSQILLLNEILPDAMVLGNHEFDYGAETLLNHLRHARFPVLAANILDTATALPIVPAYRMIEKNGLRVGIVGLSAPDLRSLVIREALERWDAVSPDSVLPSLLHILRADSVRLVVVLSHMGYDNDSLLALRYPEVNVIVGGHSHSVLHKPRRVGNTFIVQAGSAGRWLGKLDLFLHPETDSLVAVRGGLLEVAVDGVVPHARTAALVDSLEQTVGAEMREVIGELLTPWRRPPYGRRAESTVGNWQADVMRSYAGTDIAFQNAGGIRTDVEPGPLTVGTMWRLNPFSNTFVTFAVTGRRLREMIEFQLAASLRELVQWSGLRVRYNSTFPSGRRIVALDIEGRVFDEDSLYSIVTNNYVAGNLASHFGMDASSVSFTSLPDVDRDVFIRRIRADGTVSGRIDGRMTDQAPATP